MARLNDENVPAAIKANLQPGETLKHWAYGVKQPNMGLIFLLILLAVLPGIIAIALLTKQYIVGAHRPTAHRVAVQGKAQCDRGDGVPACAKAQGQRLNGGAVHAHSYR